MTRSRRVAKSGVDPAVYELTSAMRVRREALRISQEQLARKLGTQQQNMSVREAGLEPPRLHTLIKWADALDAEVVIMARARGDEDREVIHAILPMHCGFADV